MAGEPVSEEQIEQWENSYVRRKKYDNFTMSGDYVMIILYIFVLMLTSELIHISWTGPFMADIQIKNKCTLLHRIISLQMCSV